MKHTAIVLAALAAAFITGCATSPDKLPTASVSTLEYRDYTCSEVNMELVRVTRRVDELHQSLKKKADNDAAQMAVGMLLFWPTLFFLEGGDGPEAAEYSRLKGEQEALEDAAIAKRCVVSTPALRELIGKPQAKPVRSASQEISG